MSRTREWLKRIGEVLSWIGCAGMLLWIAWFTYAVYLWRMSPASPDQSHIMEFTSHGHSHYVTLKQYRLHERFEDAGIIGILTAVALCTLGAFLGNGCKLNITISSRNKRP